MLQLKNTSPFEATISLFPNEQGIDTLYVVLKATFSIGEKVEAAEKQAPIVMADEFWGKPGQSSLKYASEIHLTKPATDIVMVGEACAPGKRPVMQLEVMLAVANRKKTVRVFGERRWENGLAGLRMTAPEPFESMPLVYERAFGGIHEVDAEKQEILAVAENPVGRGFKGKRSNSELKDTLFPNLEDPAKLISKPGDRPRPACFGCLAPYWEPRKSFAGSYDEAWQKSRSPYLPDDFDSRFFNAAHPDLICQGYLRGGEPVRITNMSPGGPLAFSLPVCEFEVSIRIAGKIENPPLNLETVLIEPGESRFSLLWRGALECDKKALKIEQIAINLKSLTVNGRAA